MKPRIEERETHHFTADDGHVGLLIPAETGFLYETQAGGTCCQHPALEGLYWPMNWRHFSLVIEDALCDAGLLEYTDHSRAIVDHALAKWDFEAMFEAPTRKEVDQHLRPFFYYDAHVGLPVQFGEAWVPVKVRDRDAQQRRICGDPPLGFEGRVMILTYPNSD